MREIKFRVFSNSTKEFLKTGSKLYKDGNKIYHGLQFSDEPNQILIEYLVEYLCDGNIRVSDEVYALKIDETFAISQFTGLRDCRFYDIYEGDILEVGGVRGVVVFLEGCFVFLEDHETSMLLYETDASVDCFCPISLLDKKGIVSVVGNIYKNKDLLKWVSLTTKNTR